MSDTLYDEWLAKAETDYEYALLGMRSRKLKSFDPICFHCQQASQKYLKAFLTRHGKSFRRTHEMAELNRLCQKVDSTFTLILARCELLNPYAVAIRYPGLATNKQDAQDAIRTMKEIRTFIRLRLGL